MSEYIITFTVVGDERFPGRYILIGDVAGAKRYASFRHRRDQAEAAIRAAFEEAFSELDREQERYRTRLLP